MHRHSYYYYIHMNKILIKNTWNVQSDESTMVVSYSEANRLLPILRSDHFRLISLAHVSDIAAKDLKFLIQLTRLLRSDGEVLLEGSHNQQLNTILKTLNLFEGPADEQNKRFFKSKPEEQPQLKVEKLAIGFHAIEAEEEIDESELLEGENIQISKKKAENCDVKPRACANCNCGRKDTETKVTKEQLVKSVNEGNPVSGCGKCFLGDSFRCGTCPYKGLPAFKPGDKLKLEQDGGVQVESASTFVSASGKVKLEL